MSKKFIKPLSVVCLILISYLPTFKWMVERWTAVDSYYSHGFLIPLICGFVAWQKMKDKGLFPAKPFGLGWLIFSLGMLTQILSALLRVYFTSALSLLLTLAGLVLLFMGKDNLKRFLFPLLFLFFMIPLPMVVISNLSFRLKILATQIAVFIVNLTGIQTVRDGSRIITRHTVLMVEDPCSGIRSLIALAAMGCLMAYYSKMSKVKKIALFLASVPVAIFSNVVRIAILTLVSEIYGVKFTEGLLHDITGIGVFVLAFFGLGVVQKLLE